MAKKKPPSKPKRLAAGRPPTFGATATASSASLSSAATRRIIRTHHTLSKQHAAATAAGHDAAAAELAAQIAAHGGLARYQRASLLGQGAERGGDSSRVLMGWLRAGEQQTQTPAAAPSGATTATPPPRRMLEVGALSTGNACARSGMFAVTRIDLHSQGAGIEQQDFMARPLPADDGERFDVVSLSLVLNYVAAPAARGDMLERTLEFLVRREDAARGGENESLFPSLFLVLPAPCVTNSRYLDHARLDAIMQSLGYAKVRWKETAKLVYYLYVWTTTSRRRTAAFKKEEVRSGNSRNNFAIVLK